MILTGKDIEKNIRDANIVIYPFDKNRVNPNSYNLSLGKKLLKYKGIDKGLILDPKKVNEVEEIIIPEEGYVLQPGVLYLGQTLEYTETDNLVPMLEGRSSTGRLGLSIHVTAGFGDIGFKGYWTLEITCIHPIIVYPGMEICQIYYIQPSEENPQMKYNNGKYQNNKGVQESRMYLDFK